MILAVFIYFCANQGLLTATPVVVNILAAGAVATTYSDNIHINLSTK